MKNIFACFIVVFSFIQLKAQTTMVTVDVRYRIDPKDPTIPSQPFFVSRLDDGFTTNDKKALLELTAMRIWQKTNSGDSVKVYNTTYDLYPGFSASAIIADCKNMKPADFSKPSGTIGGQAWNEDVTPNYFKLKSGKAVCDNLMVESNKQIAYESDTVLTTDETGENFIPLLRYRYLQPDQTSLFFTERWNFDLISGRMVKMVNYYGYYIKKYTSGGDFVGYTPVLSIQNIFPSGALAKPVLLKKNVVCDVAVNWPEQMLRNDSNVWRYAGADALNYLSRPEANIPEGDRSKFLAGVFNFALNNPKNVYRMNGNKVDSLHPYQSSEEIEKIFLTQDSIQFENPMNPGVWVSGLIITKRSLGDIYAIRFYEDWYYDANEYTIKKVVRGIGLIMLNRNNMGEPVLEDAGIYIKMN